MLRFPSSNEIYVKAMLPLRQGYPLSAPQPISSLPVEKRRAGVIIGDIGIIRDDGSFEYLFNPFLPTTGPKCRNDIPTAFNDTLPPVARTSQVRNALNSRKALCSLESHGETDVCSPLSSAVHDPCLQVCIVGLPRLFLADLHERTRTKKWHMAGFLRITTLVMIYFYSVCQRYVADRTSVHSDRCLGSSRRAFKGRPLQIRPLQILLCASIIMPFYSLIDYILVHMGYFATQRVMSLPI